MSDLSYIGKETRRIEGLDKVSGKAIYTGDLYFPGMLYTAIATSPHAHAKIISMEYGKAASMPGVHGVFSGDDFPFLMGLYLGDKYPLAREKVRHYGEAVVAVVADSEAAAQKALRNIKILYKPLPVISNTREAIKADAPLVHETMENYLHISAIFPEPGSNIAHRTRIRKGDADSAFKSSDVIIEESFALPLGDHGAIEPRCSIAQIDAEGKFTVHSSSQSPFVVKNLLSHHLGIPSGDINLVVPYVGGGFGGKAGIQLELLACLLSKKCGGRPVRVANSREHDMASSPGKPGLDARIKLGATKEGLLTAAEILFLFDSGAYADYLVNVCRAAGYACTGPYRIENVKADSLCVYTNHPYGTAYRGFGHIELSFAIERAMDILAEKLNLDPWRLRRINAIKRGDTTPTCQVLADNTGDLVECLDRVKRHIGWDSTSSEGGNDGTVLAKGISCFWKAPAIPTNTSSAAMVTFNSDGSVNVITGIVEIGQGTLTGLAQIAAEKLAIKPEKVHVVKNVFTDRQPHDWTTAASRSLFMAGNALCSALDDAVIQIKEVAAYPLRCQPNDLEVAGGKVYIRDKPDQSIELSAIVNGYTFANGNSIGGPIIGRGNYIATGISDIDPETGKGDPALEYTLGAAATEIKVDPKDGTYRVLKAVCVMDVGKVINPKLARNQTVGGMLMGLGFSMREGFVFDSRHNLQTESLRDYKLPRFGEQPEYIVDFVETPQRDGPFNARGLGEQSILGMPGALANALSKALHIHLNSLPLTPETLWKAKK